MDCGPITISANGQGVISQAQRILPPAERVIPHEKRISLALLMVDSLVWMHALAGIPQQLLAG